jgi:LysR family nitrogen assimilation transcriptional regulator
MELRQLRYFVTVARQRHFGRASDVLRVAQPALSRSVQKLEQELGWQLFERHARGVSLTPAGQDLLGSAEQLLAEAEAVRRSVGRPQEGPRGIATIGMSPGIAELISAPLVTACARRYPDLRLRISSSFSPSLQEWTAEGRVDLAILSGICDPARFVLTPLLHDPLCLVCRADDRRFGSAPLDLGALTSTPLVLIGPTGSAVQQMLYAALAGTGLTVEVAAQVDTAAVAKRLVVAGVGPTVDVAAMAQAEIAHGLLKAVPIGQLKVARVIAQPRGRQPSPAVLAAKHMLAECVQDLLQQGRWLGGITAAAPESRAPLEAHTLVTGLSDTDPHVIRGGGD